MDKARKRIGNEEWVIRKDESKKRNLEEESGTKKKTRIGNWNGKYTALLIK